MGCCITKSTKVANNPLKSIFNVTDRDQNGAICLMMFNKIKDEPNEDDEFCLSFDELFPHLNTHFIKGFEKWDENGNEILTMADYKLKGLGQERYQMSMMLLKLPKRNYNDVHEIQNII